MIVTLLAAAVIFWLSYDGGSYSVTSRTTLAMGVWWTVIVGVALGILPAGIAWRRALVPAAFLAAFAVWTVASTSWAASAENAFIEFDRVALYLGVFVLAFLVASRLTAGWIADGLALGISAVGFLALGVRLFPSLVSQSGLQALLPTAFSRLSYPVNYWNGLGILLALAFPLLLRAAAVERSEVLRGAALVPLPALSAAIYLASSRGAVAAAALGALVLLVFARERWAIVEAGTLAGAASLLAVLVLHARATVVNPPLRGAVPSGPGHSAALLIALLCLGAGAAYVLRLRFVPPLPAAPVAGRAAAALMVAGGLLAVLVSHPLRHFQAFKAPPVLVPPGTHDYVQGHLFSSNGSGRWQFWNSALDEFRHKPFHGGGAGSFEAWWAQHGSLAVFVRDAHSLYLETLGELGWVGFFLLAAALGSALVLGLSGLGRAAPEERTTRAALLAVAFGYLLAVAIDWMWELTVVSVVGFVCLGLVAGLGGSSREDEPRKRLRAGTRLSLAVPVAAVGLGLIAAQAIALVAETRLDASQAAVRRGDTSAALSSARSASDVEPWAASPYLQLALIEEQANALPEAERRIQQAIHRDETDWRLWLTAARIQTKRGEIRIARRSLERARELNPRSGLLAR